MLETKLQSWENRAKWKLPQMIWLKNWEQSTTKWWPKSPRESPEHIYVIDKLKILQYTPHKPASINNMVAAALIETQNQSAPFDKLLNQIPQYKWRLEGFPPSSYFQILPTLEDVSKTEILAQRLLGKQRLTTIQVNSLQTLPISLHTALNPEEWNKLELAAQYEHIGQVLKTTLSLKRFLIEKKLSERRIMAFQCGTGFPLPLSNDSDFVLKAYLPYGEGILGYIPKPGVAGHTENDEDILQEKKNPHHFQY